MGGLRSLTRRTKRTSLESSRKLIPAHITIHNPRRHHTALGRFDLCSAIFRINASNSSSLSSAALEPVLITVVGGNKRFVAWRYSWAALLSPPNALSYRLSNSFWVRSGDPWISVTRRSHSERNAGFFSHRRSVVGSTPNWRANSPWVRGRRSELGVTSQSMYCSWRMSTRGVLSAPWCVPILVWLAFAKVLANDGGDYRGGNY